ncbi:MAG: hypothetical protein RR741_05520 [Erysipelotrichaceae bacterium]
MIATVVTSNKNQALMQYQIKELDKKVEKHNNVVERMAVAENSIKSAHHRIDEAIEMIGKA